MFWNERIISALYNPSGKFYYYLYHSSDSYLSDDYIWE